MDDNYYNYTESGLDNVWVAGVGLSKDVAGRDVFTLRNLPGLHHAIAQAVVRKTGMAGKELRFLRTEMGATQEEMANFLHVAPLTVGRWERGEKEIDKNAETLVRVLAMQRLDIGRVGDIEKLSALGVSRLSDGNIVIDEVSPGEYRPRDDRKGPARRKVA
jgi:DNA-binding transcriptional regulator YiaG